MTVAAAIIVCQIILPPSIGLADNGDFAKIIGRFGLRARVDDPADQTFRYVHLHYQRAPQNVWISGFHSSERLLVKTALLLNRAISPKGEFDIRVMGAVHAALFLLAFALVVPLLRGIRPASRIVLLALAVLIFCDVSYSAQYNSFYMDTGTLVFLALSIALLLRASYGPGPRTVYAWLALASCALMVTAKTQHAVLALPLAAFVIWQRHALWPRRAVLCGTLAAASITGAGAYSLLAGAPRDYAGRNLFSAIFVTLLPTASDPQAELESLGLDGACVAYIGLDAFAENSPWSDPARAERLMRGTSFGRLALFYVTHPGRTLVLAKLGLVDASKIRQPNIGNFDKSAGHPPNAVSNAFSIWTTVKRAATGRCVWVYPLVFAVAVGVIARKSRAAACALGAMGALDFAVGATTDGVEVTRHLCLFNAIWDVALFAAFCLLIVALDKRLKER